jgi:hypothetical protein
MSVEVIDRYPEPFELPVLGEALPGQDIVRLIDGELPPIGARYLTQLATIRSLSTPTQKANEISTYRHDITRAVDYSMAKTTELSITNTRDGADIIDARDEALYGVEVVAGELMQNAIRYGEGLTCVDLGYTPDRQLYIGVRNLAPTYPEGKVLHERDGRRPLELGRRAVRSLAPGERPAHDEHGWGNLIVDKFVQQRGMFLMKHPDYEPLEVVDADNRVIGAASLLQTVAWATIGKPKQGMNLFDFEEIA